MGEKVFWRNWYSHPSAEAEYHGNYHETEEAALAAAADELSIEPRAQLLRTEKVWVEREDGGDVDEF